jgi:hypothetical protein
MGKSKRLDLQKKITLSSQWAELMTDVIKEWLSEYWVLLNMA